MTTVEVASWTLENSMQSQPSITFNASSCGNAPCHLQIVVMPISSASWRAWTSPAPSPTIWSSSFTNLLACCTAVRARGRHLRDTAFPIHTTRRTPSKRRDCFPASCGRGEQPSCPDDAAGHAVEAFDRVTVLRRCGKDCARPPSRQLRSSVVLCLEAIQRIPANMIGGAAPTHRRQERPW